MEPSKIRINRCEHSIAVNWDDDPNWYRFEPEDMKYLEDSMERFRVGPGPGEWEPDHEWIDPFQDPRPDIKRWTEPMRSQLRQALQMLDYAERHPWSG